MVVVVAVIAGEVVAVSLVAVVVEVSLGAVTGAEGTDVFGLEVAAVEESAEGVLGSDFLGDDAAAVDLTTFGFIQSKCYYRLPV